MPKNKVRTARIVNVIKNSDEFKNPVKTARLVNAVENSDENKNPVKTARVINAFSNELNEAKVKTGKLVKCRPNSIM